MRKINLSAGPSALPEVVLERLRDGVLDFNGLGVGIFELGHRTKDFMALVDDTKARLLKLLGASDTYEVLFLTGGATQMFSTVPLNVQTKVNKPAGYIISGHWAKEALQEAKKFREVSSISSSEDNGFRNLPKQDFDFSEYAYVHVTSNNTIFGTQLNDFPRTGSAPLVCDASSDILSRAVDIDKFGLIYAGAQKNLGTSGVTIVIVRKDLIESGVATTNAKNLALETYSKSNSLHNTPPVSAIVAVYEMLKWIEEEGGVSALEVKNTKKAEMIYSAIDSSNIFKPYVDKEARSKMNITFRARTEEEEVKFIKYCEANNVIGLAGHRSVGGLRASLYNVIDVKDVEVLVGLIKDFESKNS
jgi:phosphoserine aminotransferase